MEHRLEWKSGLAELAAGAFRTEVIPGCNLLVIPRNNLFAIYINTTPIVDSANQLITRPSAEAAKSFAEHYIRRHVDKAFALLNRAPDILAVYERKPVTVLPSDDLGIGR